MDAPGHGAVDQVSFTYDPSRGSLLPDTRTDPLPVGTTTFGYDAFNRRTTVTDPNGVTTTTVYDALDRVTSVTQEGATGPEDLVTTHVYNTYGDLKRTILPRGNVVEYVYDDAGRLTSIERKPEDLPGSHGELVEYMLNAFGQRTLETHSRWEAGAWVEKSKTELVYGSRCHLDQRIDGKGSLQESVTDYEYDCNGSLTKIWDPNHPKASFPADPTTVYEYDSLDRLERITQPNGSMVPGAPATVVTEYGYDVQDHLVSVTDGEGTVTTYAYSDRDLLTEENSEVSSQTLYVYGDHGQLDTRTDARGTMTTNTVDVLNRVTDVDLPGTDQDIEYTYDDLAVDFSLGRLTRISRDGHDVDMEYDRFGRQTRDGDLTFTYDANGNRDSVTYPDGSVASFTFDYADRPLTADLTPFGQSSVLLVTDASYLPGGPLDMLDLGNLLVENRAYDERYHPEGIVVGGLLSWSYATDAVGNIELISDLLRGPASDRDYGYQDIQYYLTGADGPWGMLDWTYDEIGSRLSETRDGVEDTYSYVENTAMSGNTARLDEILVGGTDSRTYGYDLAGNQTTITETGDGVAWTYDAASRLASQDRATVPAESTFLYDGRSFLREAWGSAPAGAAGVFCDGFESGSTTEWGGAGSPCFEERRIQPTYGSEGRLYSISGSGGTRNVIYFGQRPVATWDDTRGLLFLSTDHLGTPVLATDEAGVAVWSGGFEAFGADWQAASGEGASDNGVFLRLPGQWDDDVWAVASLGGGLYHNVHRWYDPTSGRYGRADPVNIGRLLNGYVPASRFAGAPRAALAQAELRVGNPKFESIFGYGASNPMAFSDPDGRVVFLAALPWICGSGPALVAVGDALLIAASMTVSAVVVSSWWNMRDEPCQACADAQSVQLPEEKFTLAGGPFPAIPEEVGPGLFECIYKCPDGSSFSTFGTVPTCLPEMPFFPPAPTN